MHLELVCIVNYRYLCENFYRSVSLCLLFLPTTPRNPRVIGCSVNTGNDQKNKKEDGTKYEHDNCCIVGEVDGGFSFISAVRNLNQHRKSNNCANKLWNHNQHSVGQVDEVFYWTWVSSKHPYTQSCHRYHDMNEKEAHKYREPY